ncbi:MAG TPA: YceI family protein [Burkholderiales bacterium]|jgi:polyisoprenoid-binding protein YceI
MFKPLLGALALLACAQALAAPVTYKVDPEHTYPSFEADHMGMSTWRGKFVKSAGSISLDKAAGAGTVEVTTDAASIDFGLKSLNKWAVSKDLLDIKKYPKVTYKGKLEAFSNGAPTKVNGELTLHGVTKPVTLTITSFKCIPHPIFKRDWCGADAQATINREDFGMPIGKEWGMKMDVVLRIQVEALAAQ